MFERPFPRWGILVIDVLTCLVALAAAYMLRFDFKVPAHEVDLLLPVIPVYILVRALSFYLARTHKSMVRYTNTEDARRLFLTVLAGSVIIGLLSVVRYHFLDGVYLLPRTIIVIDFMGSAIALIALRIATKLFYLRSQTAGKEEKRVIVYGAGEAGLITKRTLEREGSMKYRVLAFLDDDPRKVGKRLEGVLVHSSGDLEGLLAKGVDQVIIAIMDPLPEHRRRVADACIAARVPVLTIPPVSDWINGQLSAGQIREVRIEDLLGRAVIHLDDAEVHKRFAGKRVLVTGAAGSIGSEIVRQLAIIPLGGLFLLDTAESPLYDLDMELRASGAEGARQVLIGDVRDRAGMERLFLAHGFDVIFHAAAYKHVPLMEAQPSEAVHTNVLGTRIMADLASAHGVASFVLISTDKAVNPTSVMGASKRIAEQYVQALGSTGPTQFITTRFGNVLGSSGSVIPLFRRQIAAGGPVTVTDPEVTRFFMTIPEAARLVLEAATMGKGGEIYVFDMGEPIRITDLADKMIRLSGKEPGRDIEIRYVGLRPGEKLYEELLATQENTLPTHHPRILIGKVRAVDPGTVRSAMVQGEELVYAGAQEELVRWMKALVPEYRSHNSVYANFDTPTGKG